MLAQRWKNDLGTRPQYEHKSGASASRYANIVVGLWECEARNNPVINNLKKNKN